MKSYPVPNIQPRELYFQSTNDQSIKIVDVSTPGEFQTAHVYGAVNLPIGSLELEAAMERESDRLHVMCAGGVRSSKVCKEFFDANLVDVEGGLRAWEAAELPVVRAEGGPSLQSQVQIMAGGMILLSATLGLLVNPILGLLAPFVGIGLVYAGVTRTCPMGNLLSMMPWNRPRQSVITSSFKPVS